MVEKNTYRSFMEKHEAERPLGSLGIDGRIILKLILKQQVGGGMDWMHVAVNSTMSLWPW